MKMRKLITHDTDDVPNIHAQDNQALSKESVFGYTGTVSGGASILSSYTICHQVCLGLIALLSIVGITVAGMPLAFLSKYTMFFWGLGAAMMGITAILYFFHPHCISGRLLSANAGFLIAGLPFEAFLKYQRFLWTAGVAIVISTLALWLWDKRKAHQSPPSCCKTSQTSQSTLKGEMI